MPLITRRLGEALCRCLESRVGWLPQTGNYLPNFVQATFNCLKEAGEADPSQKLEGEYPKVPTACLLPLNP